MNILARSATFSPRTMMMDKTINPLNIENSWFANDELYKKDMFFDKDLDIVIEEKYELFLEQNEILKAEVKKLILSWLEGTLRERWSSTKSKLIKVRLYLFFQ